MKLIHVTSCFALALSIAIAGGCATHTGNGALFGGAGGAALGAAVGSASGQAGKGAVVGGAIGAITGAIVGDSLDRQDQYYSHYDRYRHSDSGPRYSYPSGSYYDRAPTYSSYTYSYRYSSAPPYRVYRYDDCETPRYRYEYYDRGDRYRFGRVEGGYYRRR